jgi:excinuclease ABC subunit C
LADVNEYAEVIRRVERFLSGKEEELAETLREEMQQAVDALEFERAAKIRDQLKALDEVLQKQKVLSTDGQDQDVIAVVKDDRGAAIQMLFIRGGKLIGQRQYVLEGAAEAPPGEAVQEFLKQYYADAPEVPREILLPVEIEERKIVQQWLRTRRGSAVTIEVPQGGEKMKLVDLAAANAEQALATLSLEAQRREEFADAALSELQEALGLGTPPRRIEGYDISNIQGTAPVGSMVVFEDAAPAKGEYRRFRIKFHPESPNDYAMMGEMLLRRLRSFLEGDEKFAKLPDLILVDGGKGQLAAALQVRDDLGLSIPMVGLAKKMEVLFVPNRLADGGYAYEPVELPLNSPGLTVLRRLRDEAHRFALSFHRKVREKRATGSALEEIPGIGPRRRRLLLRTFGSLEGIRRATVEEIAAVPTLTRRLAEQILEHLRAD